MTSQPPLRTQEMTDAAHLRETVEAADLTAKHLRERLDVTDPARRVEVVDKTNQARRQPEMVEKANSARMKLLERAHSARTLHEMASASDPVRRLQEMEMAEKANSARRFQEMMDAADPGKAE